MKNSTLRFLLFTFGFSWAIWITVAVLMPVFHPPMSVLVPVVVLGAFGPSIVGSLMGGVFAPKKDRREFWSRAFSFTRIRWNWWLFILLLYPVMTLLIQGVLLINGGEPVRLDPSIFSSAGALLGFIVFMILGGPLAEELGWRGYLLDRFFQKWNVLKSSLIIGVIWIVWHVPLFFIEGTAQHAKGLAGVSSLLWAVEVLCLSIIVSLVYIHSNRSSLSAVMLHFMGNATFTAVAGAGYELPFPIQVTNTILYVLIAAVILLLVDVHDFRFKRRNVPGLP